MSDCRDLSSFPFAPQILDRLLKHGFRFLSDLEEVSPVDLSGECGITLEDAVSVVDLREKFRIPSQIDRSHRQDDKGPFSSCPSQSIGNLSTQSRAELEISTAKELVSRSSSIRPIITFSREIDQVLGGGVPLGQITEICGIPGVNLSIFDIFI